MSIHRAWRLFVPAAVLSYVFMPAEARADSASASKLLEQAIAESDSGDYAKCVDTCEAAWKDFQHAQIRGIEGLCETKLKRYKDGARHLAAYVNGSSDVEPKIKAAFEEAKQYVAEVKIETAPGPADVVIDGEPVGPSPVTVYVEPGDHTIEAKRDGKPVGREVRATVAGTHADVTVQIATTTGPARAPRPMWPGYLGLGLAGAGVVTGIATMVVSFGAAGDASTAARQLGDGCSSTAPSPACRKAFDDQDKANTTGNVAFGSFLAAGVLVAASIPYIVWASNDPSKRDAAALVIPVPVVSGDGGGVAIFASF